MPRKQQDIPQDKHAAPGLGRRDFLRTGPALAAAALVFPAATPHAATSPLEAWFATWGTAPAGPPTSSNMLSFSNQTLRLIAHASAGGSRVRVRLTNEMGSAPLRIGAANIGLRSSGASLVAGSQVDLSFSGRPSAVIPAGAALLSDPVNLSVAAFSDLAISIYLPDSVQATTIHDMAQQYGYVSSAGNFASTATLPVQTTISSWPFLAEVDVAGTSASVVAIGDSITDGAHSIGNVNHRWPDYLARRLQAERPTGSLPIGVVNRDIAGNSMLTEYSTALTAGYQQLIARAHTRGIAVLGATMTPFEGLSYYLPQREAVRSQANDWIRNSGAFDAVADFDLALRDPTHPTRLNPSYDSGDHLHPNDAGYQVLANAVPLAFFA